MMAFRLFQIITKMYNNIFQISFGHLFDNTIFYLLVMMHNCAKDPLFDILQTKYDWNSTAH